MKILIATGIYPPDVGGMATFVQTLSRKLVRAGHGVHIVSYGELDNNFQDEGVSVITVSRRNSRIKRYLNFKRAIRHDVKNVDLLYAQDLVSSGFPAAVVSLLTGKPLVVRLGGDFLWEQAVERSWTGAPLAEYYSERKSLHERIYLMIYRFVLWRSKLIIFNSEFQKDLYIKTFGLSLKKTVVIANPFPPKYISRDPKVGNFIFAGRFIRLKNIARLLKAYRSLKIEKRLILVGEGSLSDEYKKLIEEYGIQDKVEITTSIPQDKLKELIAGAKAVIIPSLTEVNPNIALEAIACGTPVLLTKHNGLPADIQSKLWTFDPLSESELRIVLERIIDPNQQERYKKIIESINMSHTWNNVVEDHLKFFSAYAHS